MVLPPGLNGSGQERLKYKNRRKSIDCLMFFSLARKIFDEFAVVREAGKR
jgi:hypothetical protein